MCGLRHAKGQARLGDSPRGWPLPRMAGMGARLKQVRQMVEDMVRRNEESKGAEAPPRPKLEPLALVPSGLPIAEVVERLQELQAKYPDVEVRRGRANRWELWPKPTHLRTNRREVRDVGRLVDFGLVRPGPGWCRHAPVRRGLAQPRAGRRPAAQILPPGRSTVRRPTLPWPKAGSLDAPPISRPSAGPPLRDPSR